MKSICFKCHFVGIGVEEPTCPACGFPLIVNTASVALAAVDLEALFAKKTSAPPLPGIDPEPRKAQLLAERRRVRAQAIIEARKIVARKKARRKIIGEVFAASALLAGILVTLQALGAF